MPWNEVMGKAKRGELHSGSSSGPKVTSHKQAVAIMLSEKRKAASGKTEYKAKDTSKRGQKKEKPSGFASIPSKPRGKQ